MSTGLIVIVNIIYSLGVSRHVYEIEQTSSGSDESAIADEETRQGLYVFYFYFFHLVTRSLFGIVFTVIQYTVLYPDGFDFEFPCTLRVSDVTPQISNNSSIGKLNSTSVVCENTSASEKQIWSVIVAVSNTVFALIPLGEVIYLLRRFSIFNCRSQFDWSNDTEFITVYVLRKIYGQIDYELANITNHNNPPSLHSSPDNSFAGNSLQDSIGFYKHKVLNTPRDPETCYAPNADLNDLYIDVIITTGRAQHKFSKEMDRHEMFAVYMKVPAFSIRLNMRLRIYFNRMWIL